MFDFAQNCMALQAGSMCIFEVLLMNLYLSGSCIDGTIFEFDA